MCACVCDHSTVYRLLPRRTHAKSVNHHPSSIRIPNIQISPCGCETFPCDHASARNECEKRARVPDHPHHQKSKKKQRKNDEIQFLILESQTYIFHGLLHRRHSSSLHTINVLLCCIVSTIIHTQSHTISHIHVCVCVCLTFKNKEMVIMCMYIDMYV